MTGPKFAVKKLLSVTSDWPLEINGQGSVSGPNRRAGVLHILKHIFCVLSNLYIYSWCGKDINFSPTAGMELFSVGSYPWWMICTVCTVLMYIVWIFLNEWDMQCSSWNVIGGILSTFHLQWGFSWSWIFLGLLSSFLCLSFFGYILPPRRHVASFGGK